MALDIHISVSDDSKVARAVRRIAATAQITPEQAAEQLLAEAADLHAPQPGQPEIHQTSRENREPAIRGYSVNRKPNLKVAEECPIFGMFAGKPEFSEAIDNVIASRSDRYSDLS